MVAKALILIPLALLLVACQTTEKLLNAAATAKGQAAAQIPPIVLPEACVAKVERVKLRDEPWVIFKFRWEVSADNRDRKADDCQAWADDLNRRNAGNR